MTVNKLEVLSPFDDKVLGEVTLNSTEEVISILNKSHSLYKDKTKWLKPYERVNILKQLMSLMSNEQDKLAMQIAQEGGKPLVDARVEVTRAIGGIEIAISELMHVMSGKEIPMGYTKASETRVALTKHEPIGVVVAFSAFNHPLNLIVHQVIPAIAVGCPVIVKPAISTPLSCINLVNLLYKAGLPEDWCKVILCNHNTSGELISNSKVSFLTFVGSAKVGWYLRTKVAPGVRMSLELGGAAPVILDKELNDIDQTLAGIVKGGFYHAGQVCVSVQRVYVPTESKDKFLDKLAPMVQNLTVGDPTSDKTDVGPLISHAELTRVEQWVDEAVKEGATLLCGGKKLSNSTYEPTVLVNPSLTSKVSQYEIFGPVICIYTYDNVDDAIQQANDVELPFQAAVYSKNIDFSMYVFSRIDTAAVMINDHTAFRVDWMPFAGQGTTGYNIGGIGDTMKEMTKHKMMVIKSDGII